MADFKFNQELPLTDMEDTKLKNIKGSFRLVASGSTGTVSLSANTWKSCTFASALTILDSQYVYNTGNKMGFYKTGKYVFIYLQRAKDNNTSQGCGFYVHDEVNNQTLTWGSNAYRWTLNGICMFDITAGDVIYPAMYSNTAITANTMKVWVFSVGM